MPISLADLHFAATLPQLSCFVGTRKSRRTRNPGSSWSKVRQLTVSDCPRGTTDTPIGSKTDPLSPSPKEEAPVSGMPEIQPP